MQDFGRFGHKALGYSRSGAMDPLSLGLANQLAGAQQGCAAIEFGLGHFSFETTSDGTIALGGAERSGALWWQTLSVKAGQRFFLGSPSNGVWSYLALNGGVEAPTVLGSRSTSVREGIGGWLVDEHVLSGNDFDEPSDVDVPTMQGPVRIFGSLPGVWRIANRIDRMGYLLEGGPVLEGAATEWSEPLMAGCIQIPPSGQPIVLMSECPTIGGYTVAAVVHSEDLRLVAQSGPRSRINFMS